MVSTHMRGAVIPTSVSKGFLRACTLRSVAYGSTLLILLTPVLGTAAGSQSLLYYGKRIRRENWAC